MTMQGSPIDHSPISLVSAEQRPDLIPAFAALSAPVWPTFLDADRAIVDCWDDLYAHGLARYQFAVVQQDEAGGERVLATSNSIPFEWATPDQNATLPDGGWDEVLRQGVDAAVNGVRIRPEPQIFGLRLSRQLAEGSQASFRRVAERSSVSCG